MLSTLLLLSGLFFLLGFILNERNAKYLLSGYNTMSEEQRAQLDLTAFLRFFKRFHVVFALSYLLFGLLLFYADALLMLSIFIGVYPILAYIYCVWKSVSFWKGNSRKGGRLGIIVLVAILAGIVVLLVVGLKNDRLTIQGQSIEIGGLYSVSLPLSEIDTVELIQALPAIKMKTNGFATGPVKKGYFLLEGDGTVKLILNSSDEPIIRITSSDQIIYYSLNTEENKEIFTQINQALFP